MANTPQATKRYQQSRVRRVRNVAQRTEVRTYQKRVVSAVMAKNLDEAESAFKLFVAAVDKTAGKSILHRNKAARIKSRLNSSIKDLKPAS